MIEWNPVDLGSPSGHSVDHSFTTKAKFPANISPERMSNTGCLWSSGPTTIVGSSVATIRSTSTQTRSDVPRASSNPDCPLSLNVGGTVTVVVVGRVVDVVDDSGSWVVVGELAEGS